MVRRKKNTSRVKKKEKKMKAVEKQQVSGLRREMCGDVGCKEWMICIWMEGLTNVCF